MAFAAAPSVAYGFAFGDGSGNQWLFGGPGQGVQVLEVEGLEGLPDLRSQDSSRGYMDGAFTGRDFLDSRTIVFTLQIMSDASNPMQVYLQQLQRYLMPQRSGLNVLQVFLAPTSPPSDPSVPNGYRGVRRIYGRVRRRQVTLDPQYAYGRAYATIEFFCPDPRFYSDSLSTGSATGVIEKTRSYNRTYNMTYPTSPANPSAANMVVTNNGNYETWPVFTSTGSASQGLKITSVEDSLFLSFPSLILGASDNLVIDTDTRSILLNGSPARNYLSTDSRWFSIPAGVSRTFNVSSLSGTPSCSVSFRDAYI